MYETGHIAIGIILGVLTARAIGKRAVFPLLSVCSIMPDIDLFLHLFGIRHEGPTHSIILITLSFAPLLLIYREMALPYLVATLSHPLIGDSPFVAIKILWPLSSLRFGLNYGVITNSQTHIFLEYISWLFALILLAKMGNLATFLKPLKSNILMIVPLSALLLTFLFAPQSMRPFPIGIILLHIALIFVFTYSTITGLRAFG